MYSKFRHSNHRIGAHAGADQTVPTGRLFWVALSQALRARLRSHRPTGTKAIRLSNGLALSWRLWSFNHGFTAGLGQKRALKGAKSNRIRTCKKNVTGIYFKAENTVSVPFSVCVEWAA